MNVSDFIKNISPETKLVLLIARWVVYDECLPEIRNLLAQERIDWKRLEKFLGYHEFFPFTYRCLKECSQFLTNKSMEIAEKIYYYYLVRLSYLWEESKQIVDAFNSKNLEIVPLKGVAFLSDNMYGDKAFLRSMYDIDLLIKKEELPLAEKTLEALGYKKKLLGMEEDYWKEKNYHLTFSNDKRGRFSCNVEIHWALDYRRGKPILPYLWDRIKEPRKEKKGMRLLSLEDTLFSLALHQRRFGKMLCLKNVCDVAMLLNRYKDKIDWDYILREAKIGKMRTTLYFVLAQVGLLLNVKTSSFVLRRLDIYKYKRRLIEQFILNNTFISEPRLNSNKVLYLKTHFLIYDNMWEPVRCVLDVPREQFAKFYRMDPYKRKTQLLYKIRYCYFFMYFFMKIVAILTNNNKDKRK